MSTIALTDMDDTVLKTQIQGWEELYGQPLSKQDYKEICTNLAAFFSILNEWGNQK